MRIIVTADGSRTLSSPTYGETYGSTHGALSEALHVYVQGSGVAHRLATRQPTRVLEVGFGTGLNFLATADVAVRHEAPLHYTALERDLLDARTLSTVHEEHRYRDLAALLSGWVAGVHDTGSGSRHELRLGTGGEVTLELVLGDALNARQRGYLGGGGDAYDAIYLDAFSPRANPELWTDAFLTELAGGVAPGGSLVTFSVSGAVRRALTRAGLRVSKRPGPPAGKREMLVAIRPLPEP